MSPTFPASSRDYDRSDSGVRSLQVLGGALPADLTGFVYVVAPTGRQGEDDEDRKRSIPFLNGDGTVYRIGFGASPELRWALTKPPCLWAERAYDQKVSPYAHASDWGITRMFDDLRLGGRNMLNTAFQAVRFEGGPERLLVTYESGRPFEVDPVTLEVVTPIGARGHWVPAMMAGSSFELVAGTSHPAFDPERDARGGPGPGTLFMTCFVRDSDLYAERLLRVLGLPDAMIETFLKAASWIGLNPDVETRIAEAAQHPGLVGDAAELFQAALTAWKRWKARTIFTDPSAYLSWWNGAAEPQRVTLLDEHGEPLSLRESAHQMGVTERYVVLMDAAFKFEMDLVFPDLDAVPRPVLAELRRRLSRAQPQSVRVFLVPRAELVDGASVKVRTIEVPASSVHYFVDHDDHGGDQVVLYAIDNAACDSSEFLLEEDSPAWPTAPLPSQVLGMIPCAVDLDRVVRFELDPTAQTATETARAVDHDAMWTVGLATTPTSFRAVAPGQFGDVFAYSHGFLPSAVSKLVWELYDEPDYPASRRIVSRADVAVLAARGGVRGHLCRYDASHPTVLQDRWAVPDDWLALSPTWVPGGAHGYLVVTAFGPTEKEIWIFDAHALAAGPICRLGPQPGESLPWGYTLHSTHLSAAVPATGTYRVTVDDDLDGLGPQPSVVTGYVRDHAYGGP